MFASQRNTLPDSPPPLHNKLILGAEQNSRAARILGSVSSAVESMPVFLSQDGEVFVYAGEANDMIVRRLAQLADRGWREGATRIAREFVRFEEEAFDLNEKRLKLLLYSIHIKGALTLSAGWQLSISLTQLRAEMQDAREQLLNIL